VLGAPAATLCKGVDGQHQRHRKKTSTSFHAARMRALYFASIAPGAAQISAEIILQARGFGIRYPIRSLCASQLLARPNCSKQLAKCPWIAQHERWKCIDGDTKLALVVPCSVIPR
jgi:hypothetical protein